MKKLVSNYENGLFAVMTRYCISTYHSAGNKNLLTGNATFCKFFLKFQKCFRRDLPSWLNVNNFSLHSH